MGKRVLLGKAQIGVYLGVTVYLVITWGALLKSAIFRVNPFVSGCFVAGGCWPSGWGEMLDTWYPVRD